MKPSEAKKKWQEAQQAYHSEPEVIESRKVYDNAKDAAIASLKPKVDSAWKAYLKAVAEDKPKLRWPENTPAKVVEKAVLRFRGTTESSTFRIHAWNGHVAVLSWPSGGFSTNGGWNPTPSHYFAISLTEMEHGKPKELRGVCKDGRVSKDDIAAMLDGKMPAARSKPEPTYSFDHSKIKL